MNRLSKLAITGLVALASLPAFATKSVVNAVSARHSAGTKAVVNAVSARHSAGTKSVVNAASARHEKRGEATSTSTAQTLDLNQR